MGREAFDREGSGYAHDAFGFDGPVVEKLDVGIAGDGRVDFVLAFAAKRPPIGAQLFCGVRPFGVGLARGLPIFPLLAQRCIEAGAQGFELDLKTFPDYVDLDVVGDAFQGHMRRALVDKAVPDVVLEWTVGRRLASDFVFLPGTLLRVLKKVIVIFRTHQPGAGEREGDAARVDGYPAASPVFGEIGRGAGAPEPEDAMQQRRIMSTASPASLWRLRVAYLNLKSSIAVLDAFQERAKLLMPVAGRIDAFSMVMASFDAQIHMMNLIAAAWFAQKAFKRLFEEVELASSREYATCAANAESTEMPASVTRNRFDRRAGLVGG